MNNQMRFFMPTLLLIFAGGCVSTTSYRAYREMTGTGYQQKVIGEGTYEVAFVGGELDFCKQAAFYRAAELAWEKGFRYFQVLEEKDKSFAEHASGHAASVQHSAGKSTLVSVYYYKIACFKQMPQGVKVEDATKVLDTQKRPGKDKPYTIAERLRDKTGK